MKKETERIMVSIPKDFLNKMDKIAQIEDRTRSELIREAVRKYAITNPSLKEILEK